MPIKHLWWLIWCTTPITNCYIPSLNFDVIEFIVKNADWIYVISNNKKILRENFYNVGNVFSNIVSKILKETDQFFIEKNSVLANHITPF